MRKILLTNSYYYWLDPKQMNTGQPYPPLGTLYAASILKGMGFELTFVDQNLSDQTKTTKALLNKGDIDALVLYDDGFNYLTKMCLTKMRHTSFDLVKCAKENGIPVIFNSSDSTDHYKEYHAQGVDVIIHGEGEQALEEILQNWRNDQPIDQLLGISFYKDDEVFKNPKRPVLRNLDSLPFPSWELINIEDYRKVWEENHGYFSLNMATTRGCPYKCNWCAKPIYGNRYNSRSPEKVVEELAYLIDRFDVHYFWMCDDIFGLKPNWVKRFNELIQERQLKIQYKIQSRVDLMLKDEQIDDLVESGADMIWVGAESGSQKILDAMDKGTQVEQIYEATQKLKAGGARIAFFLQFGYLDEKWADIKKTIKMVLDLMPDDIGISVSYPLPGTKFYDMVKADLVDKSNWTDSDDLDLMFKNTYKPIFYKTLHRYVHNRYRIKKAWINFKALLEGSNLKEKVIHIARGLYHLPQAFINLLLLRLRST